MKATGIVRRIDDLGRVVIPKEIRRTMKIKEGDPLEIFTDKEFICLKKYTVEERVGTIADDLFETVEEMYNALDPNTQENEQLRGILSETAELARKMHKLQKAYDLTL